MKFTKPLIFIFNSQYQMCKHPNSIYYHTISPILFWTSLFLLLPSILKSNLVPSINNRFTSTNSLPYSASSPRALFVSLLQLNLSLRYILYSLSKQGLFNRSLCAWCPLISTVSSRHYLSTISYNTWTFKAQGLIFFNESINCHFNVCSFEAS